MLFWMLRRRLLRGRSRPVAIAIVAGLVVARLALVHASVHGFVMFENDSCAQAQISTPVGAEGTCTRGGGPFGWFGATTYNVVDSGDTLRMPGYDVTLMQNTITSVAVNGPASAYPGSIGLLVSFEVAVSNTGSVPLTPDGDPSDFDLAAIPIGANCGTCISLAPQALSAPNGPAPQLNVLGTVAPGATATGWVSFVVPPWTRPYLNARPADLEVHPPGDPSSYIGQIRLWKWATSQGQAAATLPS